MDSLVSCLDTYLKNEKQMVIKELVCDFVTDYVDDRHYFLQIKYLDCENHFRHAPNNPMFHQRKIQTSNPKIHYDPMTKTSFECAGDYCDIEQIKPKDYPPVHQEIMYDIQKKKDQESKKSNDMIIANLTSAASSSSNTRKMPLNESYSYFIVQKTINKDRKITKKYPKGNPGVPTDGKFATMFDRVRVCTLCFRIYKELENYYFKELRKNLPGANDETTNLQDEDTERLMNREVKNDKDDADPRSRVDKALGGLFI